LHDVVTHHVTAMVVQADAAQFVPEKDTAGLAAISSTGRRALSELRHLLGVLEATGEHGRTPATGKVADLVDQARLAGQPVELTEEGESRGREVDVELAVYRVVQEALTNALKHAAGRPTTVLVRHGADHVEIEVVTASGAALGEPSGGRGLTGLRERVRMLGGRFEAGPRQAGFRVWARIPA
ncbi:MAG TPA: histidine kinase, partial [Lentzea sp.]